MDGGDFVMTKIIHGTIFKELENWAPKELAYEWDNVGLQVGSHTDETKKVMVTLDVLKSVVDEAIEENVNLIIAHHPLLFKPLKEINFQTAKGNVIKKLIEHNITVYAAHTNLDIARGGVNDLLCDALGIVSSNPFIDIQSEKLLKLIVFVPRTHADEMRNALGAAGAGFIGNYSHCTFQSKGQGTFMPMEGTNPFIGSTDKLEIVDELKIETIVKEKDLQEKALKDYMERFFRYYFLAKSTLNNVDSELKELKRTFDKSLFYLLRHKEISKKQKLMFLVFSISPSLFEFIRDTKATRKQQKSA